MRLRSTIPLRSLLPATIVAALFILSVHAQAKPCLSVPDLDFGTLDPGETKSLPLQLCNHGDGQITFQDPQLRWLETEFNVSQADLDLLKSSTLGPNDCITITVTFKSDVVGAFQDVGQFQVDAGGAADGCRDASKWTALVVKPVPFITGHDWEGQWVTKDNSCTKNRTAVYPADVSVLNNGTKDFIVKKVVLSGPDADAGIFSFDRSDPARTINPEDVIQAGDPNVYQRSQRILFKPSQEREYNCTVTLLTEDGDSVSNILHGTGIESHVAVENVDFGSLAFISQGNPVVDHLVGIDAAQATRSTTITGIALKYNTDYALTLDYFKADGTTRITLPYTLAPQEKIYANVRFQPQSADPSAKVDSLIVFGDFSRCDDSVGAMKGAAIIKAWVEEEAASAATFSCTVEPNPVASAATIAFSLDRPAGTSVEIYDAAGSRITSLADGILDAGRHELHWNAGGLPSGVYYCRVHTSDRGITRPVLVVR